jgi:hypothetical protein
VRELVEKFARWSKTTCQRCVGEQLHSRTSDIISNQNLLMIGKYSGPPEKKEGVWC